MSNPLDLRSNRGIFSRGKTLFNGASHTPNAAGRNQYSGILKNVHQKKKKTSDAGMRRAIVGRLRNGSSSLK